MPLIEGKGISGVVDNLNTVCLLSHSDIQLCVDPTPPTEVCAYPSAGLVSNPHLLRLSSQPDQLHCSQRMVYTPTQVINFALVPPQFRFVFVGVVSLMWSMSPEPLWEHRTDSPSMIDTYLSVLNAQLSRDIVELGCTLDPLI